MVGSSPGYPETSVMKSQEVPPRFIKKIIRRFVNVYLLEEIEGDLEELYNIRCATRGRIFASLMYAFDAFGAARHREPRNNSHHSSHPEYSTPMIKSYLKSAYRSLARRRLYSIINAVGLSVSMAFCLLVFLFIQDDLSFDRFHANGKDIFLIVNKQFDFFKFKEGNKEPFSEGIEQRPMLGEAALNELAEVKRMTRYTTIDGILRFNDVVFNERITGVDSGFFKMFSFPLVAGNSDKLFSVANSIVLTPKIATKYFGETNPIGKSVTLDLGGEEAFIVTGIIQEQPPNSSISFDIIIPVRRIPSHKDNWENHPYRVFLQLNAGTNVSVVNKGLNDLIAKYTREESRQFREQEKVPDEFPLEQLHLEELANLHLNTKIQWEKSSDPRYAYILGGIALLILVIACSNYTSLALTSSVTRSTEIGVRKISGAARRQLVAQFGTEALVLSFLSLMVGIILVVLLLPTFNSFVEKNIKLSFVNIVQFAAAAVTLAFVVGVVAGSYPALYLSAQRPTEIFKGKTTRKLKTWFLRPLVVIQFAFSAFLIMSAIVMYRQMEFVTSHDLGYNHHQVMVIRVQGKDGDRFVENFRNLVSNDRSVISVSGSATAFTQGTLTLGFKYRDQPMAAACYIVDPDYIPTLGIHLISGRNFDPHNLSDLNNAVIVNESMIEAMKWTDPLNEHLKWRFEEGPGSKVIGVVKNHHFLSLEQSIGPMFLTMDKMFDNFRYTLVKLAPEGLAASVKRMEKAYKTLSPDMAFEYFFLDDSINEQYRSYKRWTNIMSVVTGFAVLISCLGLFGLAGTNVANRTKEIGIRKILGSSISSLFFLLNKQFIYFSAIAFSLSIIPAWYAMNKWLMSFQYRIQIGWILYLISFGIGLVVVLFTVSFHTWRAASVNPAETLKHE